MQEYQQTSSILFERTMPNPNKIGLLGGTFNPVHNGHILMAEIAFEEFLLGSVVFLPSGQPPHKKDEYIAPPDQRLDMIRLAIEDYPIFFLSTVETERKGTTYTVDTLEYLTMKNPGCEYYYIIGADTLFELHTWRNPERVLELVKFICILRPGMDDKNVRCYSELMNSRYPNSIFLADQKGPHISSTQIREAAARCDSLKKLVPNSVEKYIINNKVYNED